MILVQPDLGFDNLRGRWRELASSMGSQQCAATSDLPPAGIGGALRPGSTAGSIVVGHVDSAIQGTGAFFTLDRIAKML